VAQGGQVLRYEAGITRGGRFGASIARSRPIDCLDCCNAQSTSEMGQIRPSRGIARGRPVCLRQWKDLRASRAAFPLMAASRSVVVHLRGRSPPRQHQDQPAGLGRSRPAVMGCRDRRRWAILPRAMAARAMARSSLLICDTLRFCTFLSGGRWLRFNKQPPTQIATFNAGDGSARAARIP
jgi:hypothetical protein